MLPPLGFRESLFLWKDSVCVFTDSGGLQEEATGLGIPFFIISTIRENTERPVTVEEGTNRLVGSGGIGFLKAFKEFRNEKRKTGMIPELWDGKAVERIVDVIAAAYHCSDTYAHR